jgi:hypothetical protein
MQEAGWRIEGNQERIVPTVENTAPRRAKGWSGVKTYFVPMESNVIIPAAGEGSQTMKEPGLDGRHRDKNSPKAGEIQQKRSDTLNKNLSRPIPQFSPNTTLGKMREKTGKVSEEAVRRAAAKMDK